jgi:hypothetical protein
MRSDPIGQEHVVVLRNRALFRDGEIGVGFEPGDQAAAFGIEPGPEAEVVIAEIEYVGRAGLEHQLLGRGNVVDPGRGHAEVDRHRRLRIEDQVQLGGGLALRFRQPLEHAPAEVERRGVDQTDGAVQVPAQRAVR